MSDREPIVLASAPANARLERDLGQLPFFNGVSASTVEGLSGRCRWLDIQEGETLISAGDLLDKVFFVLRGEFRFLLYTRVGKVVSLRGATQGSFICEAALVGETSIPYSIEAARFSTVASINARTFVDHIEHDRDLLRAVMRSAVERQGLLAEQVVELTTLDVHGRIKNELARLCRESINPDGSATIHPFPTHTDLARRIGTHREAVSRAMSHLQYVGAVARDGEGLFIPDVARLTHAEIKLRK